MNNNKLIAEFMDVQVRMNMMGEESYRPDKYWECLMPVVEKIEQVHEGVPQELINLSLFSTRDEVYKAVVEFINEHKKKA